MHSKFGMPFEYKFYSPRKDRIMNLHLSYSKKFGNFRLTQVTSCKLFNVINSIRGKHYLKGISTNIFQWVTKLTFLIYYKNKECKNYNRQKHVYFPYTCKHKVISDNVNKNISKYEKYFKLKYTLQNT